jgi:hypothetical protein
VNHETAQFICEKEGIEPVKLACTKCVNSYTGDLGSRCDYTIYPRIEIDGYADRSAFYITKLHRSMIIGKAWMKRHGMSLHLGDDSISFNKEVAQCDCTAPKTNRTTVKDPPSPSPIIEVEKAPIIQPTQILQRPLQDKKTKPALKSQALKSTGSISMIGAAPFRTLARQEGAQVFSVQMEEVLKGYQEEEVADEAEVKRLLPKEYHDLVDVFSKSAANQLPEHRSSDHRIELEKDADTTQLGKAPLYRMSAEELQECKAYIDENLSKGFITASSAPFSAPVLFVRKAGGGLRFCVDYRRLNALTKKDKYPLPLINETLAQLTGARFLTKIDIRHAFNRIRMRTDDEDLTTFGTRFGAYKYRVMPFGLCNGPATFQHYMNDVLWEGLNDYCTVYVDDILVYSSSTAEHVRHVRSVLEKLRAAGLQADIKKCEFSVKETRFLGLIVGVDGIKVDPEKVKAIVEWDTPRTLTDVRAFLGFSGFYRCFVRDYSKIIRPMILLTKKGTVFDWDLACQEAFDQIKSLMVEAPILQHFDPTRTCFVECDASDYVTSGILSQKDSGGILHPVAFFSRKMLPAECNYEIYDKELMAIVRCFKEWRPDLEGTDLPIQVLTDHKSLEYFMTTKRLTRRQVRWAEFLADFNFQITYRPGKENGKADALTRRSQDLPEDAEDDRQKAMSRIVLPEGKVHPDITKGSTVAEITVTEDALRKAQEEDMFCQEILGLLRANERFSAKISLSYCDKHEGLLRYQRRFWIPEGIRTDVVRDIHTQPMVGHPGIAKTLAIIKKRFYWPRMDKTVAQYITNYHECRRAKPFQDTYNGVLIPLPIPQQPWQDISMDFVTELPEDQGFNSILVVTCRMSKERHLIPCKAGQGGISAESTAELFIQNVVRLHGLPDTAVSDRGTQFVARFWRRLCEILAITVKLSTAFHPESDGQTEVENKEMERYLRTYVSYQQDDWVKWLALAEFAANNAPSATTLVSPFFATRGYDPRLSFDFTSDPKARHPKDKFELQRAIDTAKKLHGLWEWLQEQIGLAQTRMEHFANQSRKPAPAYRVGDRVYLSARNIRTQRPSRKLDAKNLGPFKILEKVGPTSYRLKLDDSMKIHPVFHSNLLRLDPENPLPGQVHKPADPVEIEGQLEYEVDKILDSRIYYGRLQYRASWVGYPPDSMWYEAENFENSADAVREFHAAYPRKPGRRSSFVRRFAGAQAGEGGG